MRALSSKKLSITRLTLSLVFSLVLATQSVVHTASAEIAVNNATNDVNSLKQKISTELTRRQTVMSDSASQKGSDGNDTQCKDISKSVSDQTDKDLSTQQSATTSLQNSLKSVTTLAGAQDVAKKADNSYTSYQSAAAKSSVVKDVCTTSDAKAQYDTLLQQAKQMFNCTTSDSSNGASGNSSSGSSGSTGGSSGNASGLTCAGASDSSGLNSSCSSSGSSSGSSSSSSGSSSSGSSSSGSSDILSSVEQIISLGIELAAAIAAIIASIVALVTAIQSGDYTAVLTIITTIIGQLQIIATIIEQGISTLSSLLSSGGSGGSGSGGCFSVGAQVGGSGSSGLSGIGGSSGSSN
jgi:hypothetical protein